MRFALVLWALVAGLLFVAHAPPATAAAEGEKRIALVIGIGAYQNAPELPNPPNDAKAISQSLRKLGFTVDEKLDLSNRGLAEALRTFGVQASKADVAVLYFAGHGMQVGGTNYLIPSDARLERERDLMYEALPLTLPLGEVAQARKLGIVILDACRNNPFVDRLTRTGTSRHSIQPGIGRVDDTPSDTLVAMATRADAVAEDGTGNHSPYAEALLKNLDQPGLELSLFFRRVRDDVMQSTQGRQEPFVYGSLGAAPFYFNPQPENRRPVLADLRPVEVLERGGTEPLRIGRPSDPDNDALFAQVAGLPRGGSVRIGERVVLIGDYLTIDQLVASTFRPDGSHVGEAGAFEFAVMDGRGGVAKGGVPIFVKPSNRPPVAMVERTIKVSPNLLRVDAPSDPDGDPLTVVVTAVPEQGKVRDGTRPLKAGDRLSVEALAALTFDPEQAKPGRAGTFTVLIEDGRGGRASSSVVVEVEDPGAAPDAPAAVAGVPVQVAAAPAAAPAAAAEVVAEPPALALATPPAVAEPAAGAQRTQGKGNGFQDCPECPVMVRIPAGSFTMGHDRGDTAQRPAHTVTVSKPFALGAYEVTVGEWRACVEGGGCTMMPRMTNATDDTPVHNIDWNDAQAYVAWLARKTGQRYRLPSEAEWEYAARSGGAARFSWGEGAGTMRANCRDCGGSFDRLRPASVGSFPPNAFGIHDMNGGVAEWVADCWNPGYRGAPADGSAWTSGDCKKRVLRGGSWRDDLEQVSATARIGYDADVRYLADGLRVARDLN
ncbi:MAG TPA: SUMF1/EgtB/PvdO family nonheme iron enzyme [Azospirillum sp.]|nr:SUMF1/EgtB/PvdO family nonheme iron enzyme [Azospirillum sp.]